MPDHLHCFCAPSDLNFTIEQWIKYWKAEICRKHGHADLKFQARGWHHRLRDGECYAQKWLYVQENPIRKGLVTHIEEWQETGGGPPSPPRVERWARSLANAVNRVMARYPEADPEDVRRTLICLQSSPLERLNRSLRRGRGFAAFRK